MEEEEFFESGNQESLKQYNDYNVGYVADGDIARLRSKFRVVSQSVQELEETLARLSKEQNESIQQLHQNMEIAMERSGKNVKEIADEAVIAKQKLSEVRLFDKLEPLHDRIWSMNLEIEQIEQEESMGFVHPDEVTELKAENDELKQNVFLAEQSMYELKDAFEEMQTKFHQNQEELRAEREKKQSLQESIFCLHSLIAAMRDTNHSQAALLSQRKSSRRRKSDQIYWKQDCSEGKSDPLDIYLNPNSINRTSQSDSSTINRLQTSSHLDQNQELRTKKELQLTEKCEARSNTDKIVEQLSFDSKQNKNKTQMSYKFDHNDLKYSTLPRNTKLFQKRRADNITEGYSQEEFSRMFSLGTVPRRRKTAMAHHLLFLHNSSQTDDRFHRNEQNMLEATTTVPGHIESPSEDRIINECQISRSINETVDYPDQALVDTEHSDDCCHVSDGEDLLSESTLDQNYTCNSDLESELDETFDHSHANVGKRRNLLATLPDNRTYRVAVAGNTNVGKTSLLFRICNGHNAQMKPRVTIGCDFFEKTVLIDNYLTVNLQFFDTAGTEQYRSISRSYFRRADGIILVYDCTDIRSFKDIHLWIDQIEWSTDKREVPIMLCANKNDALINNVDKSVDFHEAQKMAAKHANMEVYQISAHDGTNVDQVVNRLCLLMREYENNERASILTLKYDSEPKAKTKCFTCFA